MGEIEFKTIYFADSSKYDTYLKKANVWPDYGHSRALGVLRSKTQAEVLIDKGYYLSGGIREEELPAIALHEQIELTSKGKNPHLDATVGEYRFIFGQFGKSGLNQYHTRLCNLIGGDNSIRFQALGLVLGGG